VTAQPGSVADTVQALLAPLGRIGGD
jgi:hypothetical protein